MESEEDSWNITLVDNVKKREELEGLKNRLIELESRFKKGNDLLAKKEDYISFLKSEINGLQRKVESTRCKAEGLINEKNTEFEKRKVALDLAWEKKWEDERIKHKQEMTNLTIRYEDQITELKIGRQKLEHDLVMGLQRERAIQSDLNSRESELEETKAELERLKKERVSLEKTIFTLKVGAMKQINSEHLYATEIKSKNEEINQLQGILKEAKEKEDKMTEKISKKLNDIHSMLCSASGQRIGDEVVNLKVSLSQLSQDSCSISQKLTAIESYQKHGGKTLVDSGAQTDPEESDDNSRGVAETIMDLKVQLLTAKNEMLDLRKKNEDLKNTVKNITAPTREIVTTPDNEEDEARIDQLERNVRELRLLLSQRQRHHSNEDLAVVTKLFKNNQLRQVKRTSHEN